MTTLLRRAIAFACLLAGGPALATPGITRIEPPGAPQGTEIEVIFRGRELANPRELVFEDGRIEVTKLEGVDGATVKAILRVPADCPLGRHRLRIRTAEGLSDLRSFRVGIFPQQGESEPNNDFDSAQRVSLPCTISGVIKGEDLDCFKIRLPAGGRIAAAVDAIRLEQQFFDPHLELVDARGFVVAACDDHPLLGQDAMLRATVAEEGDYIVRLRESAYGGNDNCLYLLHLADFPVAHVAWPPAGPPGSQLEVEWLGDAEGPFRQRVTLPAAGLGGLAEIHPVRDGSVSPVPVPIRLTTLSAATEAEPNDEPGKATPVSAPVVLLGRLDAENDVDWFRVTAPKGTKWHVRGWGRRLGGPIDLVLNAHRDDAKRERITGNDDAEGPDSALQLTVPNEGSFLIRVNDHQKRGGPAFVYCLEVEEALPEVNVSVPVARSNTQERLVAVVPRGNRSATVLNTARNDFSGPVRIALDGLPAGVAATLADAAGNAPATLAVFEAAADAEPTTVAAGVRVTAAEDGRGLGGLRQKTDLVFGPPNNIGFQVAHSDRLPVAVVEEAPIRIEVEQPAGPIVRRGSLELKVTVERLAGFEGKVRLFFPFRPPGIGAATSVEIAADSSGGVYPLSANPDAPLGAWQVAVTAMGQPTENSRGEGEMLVSSRLVTLRVCEPMLELAAEPIDVEQGREARLVWQVTKAGEFSGVAKGRLLGLPAKTEAPEVDFLAAVKEVVFPVAVAADTPAGQYKNVTCEYRVPEGSGWVVHASPPMTLRIDKPLPPEEEPKPAEEPKP